MLAPLLLPLLLPPLLTAAAQAGAPPPSPAPAELGREQANAWMPLAMLAPATPAARRRMLVEHIRQELAARGSTLPRSASEPVLAAIGQLDRERFLPPAERRRAYLPVSLDIGEGQTLSDAYLVTVMVAAAGIGSGARVLDVGTGSGYQAALLDQLGARVTTIEILPGLARRAARRLRRLGYSRIRVVTGDGALGDPATAPFDAILVAAGATTIPRALVAQLAPGGRLVMPIGPTQLAERLLVIRRAGDGVEACTLGAAAAVPLTGLGGGSGLPAPALPPPCYGRPVT